MGVPGFCHEEPVIERGIVEMLMLFGFVYDCGSKNELLLFQGNS